jgi:hypothetical protein
MEWQVYSVRQPSQKRLDIPERGRMLARRVNGCFAYTWSGCQLFNGDAFFRRPSDEGQ